MSEDQNNEVKNEDGEKTEVSGKVSVIENMRRINEKQRREELEAEAEREKERAEQERRERERYEKKLERERIELIKLKQGVISEEDIPHEKEPVREYTVWEKIGNFFYHNKMPLFVGAIIVLLVVFLVRDIVTNKKPDVAVMIMANDREFDLRTGDIEKLFEPYCEDFNGDGEVYVRVSYLPAIYDDNSTDVYFNQSYQTKLMAEFQGGDSIVVIADAEVCKTVGIDTVSENGNPVEPILADMRTIYPDDENSMQLGYMLSGTSFAEDIKYTEMSDGLFIGFRVPREALGVNMEKFTANYNNALKLWDNYLNKTEAVHDENVKFHSEQN
ncbi:MAG: hypothetical protein ACI4JK_06650 [Oscillospiraceae bacterium]